VISRIERYFFGPVAAARPYLFGRVFLLLVSIDMWLDFVLRGWLYGGGEFNVPHVALLEPILPTPTPELYVALTVLVSFGSLIVALGRWDRVVIAGVLVLFTCSWMMSQLDSYQHHYLMSLVLFALVFFPQVNAADILDAPGDDDESTADDSEANPPLPKVTAWAYLLVGCQVAIVYLWTAIAKMDAAWLSGRTVKQIVTSTTAKEYVEGHAGLFWVALAVGGIVAELALALLLPLVIAQDRRAGRRCRVGSARGRRAPNGRPRRGR